jgi:hypothetical protein
MLLGFLEQQRHDHGVEALLVHLSTDQVSGVKLAEVNPVPVL